MFVLLRPAVGPLRNPRDDPPLTNQAGGEFESRLLAGYAAVDARNSQQKQRVVRPARAKLGRVDSNAPSHSRTIGLFSKSRNFTVMNLFPSR
jgi:hypothetical protein